MIKKKAQYKQCQFETVPQEIWEVLQDGIDSFEPSRYPHCVRDTTSVSKHAGTLNK